MPSLQEAAEAFLDLRRIAVAGVSRDTKQPANLIYRRLRDTGHEVFAVNPHASEVEGDLAYPTVGAIPGGAEGVVVVTTPQAALDVIADCAAAGVHHVWLHRGIGPGSTSDEAVALCRRHGIEAIPGGCPNMFGTTSDAGHRCMRVMLMAGHRIARRLPDAAVRVGHAASCDPTVAP
jgi:predicted CoA-binding protein